MSHKIGRLLVPYALIAVFAASVTLAGEHVFYTLALIAQCALYLLGGYGAWLDLRSACVAPAATADSPQPLTAKGIVNA
jgi:hypothetical protein